MTVWPSGLRRWLEAPVRKGVGSNPTAVTIAPQGCSLLPWQLSRVSTASRSQVVCGAGCRLSSARARVRTPRLSSLRPGRAHPWHCSARVCHHQACARQFHKTTASNPTALKLISTALAVLCYSCQTLPRNKVSKTVWPSGLRRWLQAPVRKGVGSNPTAVIEFTPRFPLQTRPL